MDANPGHAARRARSLLQAPSSVAGASRLLGVVMLCAAFAALVSLVPLDYKVISNSRDTQHIKLGLVVQESKAFADGETPYSGADTFLDLAARASDISSAQLVSTIGEMVTITTGRPVSFGDGLSPRATLAGNLGNLIDAADYPAWGTLSDEDKQAWGSKENYDAAKFNSLMRGFGLGDSLDDFKGSAGSSFTFGDAAKKRLQQIGRIGSLWAGGAAVKIQELQNMIADMQSVDSWFVPVEDSPQINFDATEIAGWPTALPKNLTIGYGTECHIYEANGREWIQPPFTTSRDVFWLLANKSGTSSMWVFAFDANTFGYRSIGVTGAFQNAGLKSVSGYSSYYWREFVSGFDGWRSNMPINVFSGNASYNDFYKAMAIMVSEKIAPQAGAAALIPDYPEDPVNPEERVYMPDDGIGTEENSYNYYFAPPIVPRPDNPYNPDGQTDGNQWREDTTSNLMPLTGINFDQLFPFSMLADIPLLFNKVQQLAPGGATGQYSSITVPLDWGPDDENLVIDLTWLHDLLLMTRPAVLILLVAGLLWVTVEFWKSILTG